MKGKSNVDELACRFAIARRTVYNIWARERWKHVETEGIARIERRLHPVANLKGAE